MASIIKANQLQDFGGNSIIGSDGAGNLTTQKMGYPAFKADTSGTSVANQTNVKLQFNNEIFDTNGNYDNSTNYRFTPSVAGKYILIANARVLSLGDAKEANLQVRKNGDYVAYQVQKDIAGAGGEVNLSVSVIMESDGSADYFEVFMYQNSGSTKSPDCSFAGYRIGS
jgi:hypothetical protein